MDKYIGFDISSKDVNACVTQKNQRERYATIGPHVGAMRKFLANERKDNSRVHLSFGTSGPSASQ